ncbi:hypothetical protein [Methylococcus sp. Mc7]|uniref:hypothetical protein n=2 Tax=unclassified Methylococcus TaxID=2618889 RepID=UPI001C532BD0|nr:hypothetical protein [Methylococcus sp. Mc7]QXP83115.1 hypothetical protein KW115_13055 [Methylococcus sp. Mc7]
MNQYLALSAISGVTAGQRGHKIPRLQLRLFGEMTMAMNLKAFFSGPEWVEVSVPDWFRERTETVIRALGDDHADVQLFKDILAAGKVSEEAAERADALAGTTQNSDVFLLAVDIAYYAFTVLQTITQVVPVTRPQAA